jgi:hypothetical protein
VNSGWVVSNANEGNEGKEMHKYQDMEYGSQQISKNWAITVCIIRNQIFNSIYVSRHSHLAILLKRFQKKDPKKIQFPTCEQQFQIIKNEVKQVRLS